MCQFHQQETNDVVKKKKNKKEREARKKAQSQDDREQGFAFDNIDLDADLGQLESDVDSDVSFFARHDNQQSLWASTSQDRNKKRQRTERYQNNSTSSTIIYTKNGMPTATI